MFRNGRNGMIHLVIVQGELKCTEAFTALEKTDMVLDTSLPEFRLLSILSLGTIVQKISTSVAELIRPLVYADIDAHTSKLQTTEFPIVQTIITPEVDSVRPHPPISS